MFAAGDLVIYGGNGVCEVTEVGPLRGSRGAERKRLYYTLRPRSGTETIYAPVDTPVYMRGIISREEAERLIDCIPELSVQVCNDRNLRALTDHYKASLDTHDCLALLETVKAVYLKGKQAAEQRRKPGQVDQRFGKRAEELLHGELAAALDIPVEEVKPYIAARVKALEKRRAGARTPQ